MSRKKDQPKSRRGLVLAGGGAKGAYQFGAILALKAAGVRIDCIAGTSVGALNGALLSTNSLEYGKQFWQTLSFENVYPPRRPIALFFPLMLIHMASRAFTDSAFASGAGKFGCLCIGGLTCGLPLGISWWYTSDTLLGKMVSIPMFFAFALGVAYAISRTLEFLEISGLSAEPLEREIASFLKDSRLSIPLFATVAEHRVLYDPDRISWGITEGEWTQEFPGAYVAKYVRIAGDPEGHEKTLLASAALPYGIVPRVGKHVDGGLADNEPIFPLISIERCDELVVIRLKPLPRLGMDRPNVWWRRMWMFQLRQQAVCMVDSADLAVALYAKSGMQPPECPSPPFYRAIKLQKPKHWPERIITIAPRDRLGGLLSGTLNFRRSYASRLLEQGYEDTRAVIAQYPDLARAKRPVPPWQP